MRRHADVMREMHSPSPFWTVMANRLARAQAAPETAEMQIHYIEHINPTPVAACGVDVGYGVYELPDLDRVTCQDCRARLVQ